MVVQRGHFSLLCIYLFFLGVPTVFSKTEVDACEECLSSNLFWFTPVPFGQNVSRCIDSYNPFTTSEDPNKLVFQSQKGVLGSIIGDIGKCAVHRRLLENSIMDIPCQKCTDDGNYWVYSIHYGGGTCLSRDSYESKQSADPRGISSTDTPQCSQRTCTCRSQAWCAKTDNPKVGFCTDFPYECRYPGYKTYRDYNIRKCEALNDTRFLYPIELLSGIPGYAIMLLLLLWLVYVGMSSRGREQIKHLLAISSGRVPRDLEYTNEGVPSSTTNESIASDQRNPIRGRADSLLV